MSRFVSWMMVGFFVLMAGLTLVHAIAMPPPTSLELPPLPSKWNVDYVRQILYFAEVAFCDSKKIEDWTCSWCSHNPHFKALNIMYNNITMTRGVIAVDPDNTTVIVAFRGSDAWMNWLLDLDPAKVSPFPGLPKAKVHRGFLTGYNALKTSMHNTLRSIFADRKPRTIIFTGHSLGGALATLATIDVKKTYAPLVKSAALITFGSPRVGNFELVQHFKSLNVTSWRHVHARDIVPHWPFKVMPPAPGYHHVPQEYWEYDINNPDLWRVCDNSGEDPKCARSLKYFFQWRPNDHMYYVNTQLVPCT